MKYDDASWHHGGDFPRSLPESAGATHIAMFVSWAVLNGLAGDLHTNDFSEDLAKLRRQEITPGEWFLGVCDGKFTDEDLSSDGNRFAAAYYGNEDGLHTAPGSYLDGFDHSFPASETLYHVPDTWETQKIIGQVIESRFARWQNGS